MLEPEYHRRQVVMLLRLARTTRDPQTSASLKQLAAEHAAIAEEEEDERAARFPETCSRLMWDFALTGSDDADASDKLSKLDKSWRSQRAGALPHCGMPSRLKTRLNQLCQTEYLPSTGRHI